MLCFFGESEIHHSGVVNNTKEMFPGMRVVYIVAFGTTISGIKSDIQGSPQHLNFTTIKMIHLQHCSTAALGGFFVLNSKKYTDTDNVRVAMPCKSTMNMTQKKRDRRIKVAGQSP